MGNESSKANHHHKHTGHKHDNEAKRTRDHRIETGWRNLASGRDSANITDFQSLFPEDLAVCLWNHISNGKETITIDDFETNITPLWGTSTDIYVRICQPIHRLIKVSAHAAGADAVESDVLFIKTLVAKMTANGSTVPAVVEWMHVNCPRMCSAVHALVGHKLLGYDMPKYDLNSDILSPMQMWYVQSCLPTIYFPKDEKTGDISTWTNLYSSTMQGISVNRFESLVFEYKGHTVTIIKLKDGRTVVLATDAIWRHSASRVGGPETMYFEIEPTIKKIEASASVYCNFKIRSASMGLSFKEIMQLDKELDGVSAIEVYGCAGASSLAAQKNLREWKSRQAEKHKKVPLPGNWDDNPDKTLLEMAGFRFSNERANMEMEARRREEAEAQGQS